MGRITIHDQRKEDEANRPNGNDDGDPSPRGDPALRLPEGSSLSGVNHHLGGDHLERQVDAKRCDDEIVEIAKNWDEIRDRVDRAEGVCDDKGSEELGVPRHSRIPVRKIEGVGFRLKALGKSFEATEWGWLLFKGHVSRRWKGRPSA